MNRHVFRAALLFAGYYCYMGMPGDSDILPHS